MTVRRPSISVRMFLLAAIQVSCLPHTRGNDDSPASLLDLSHWRLTLPIDTNHPGNPDEIRQPGLAEFTHPDHFFLNSNRDGVVFRAHCGGVPTKGSRFPRCELREMEDGGRFRAGWDTGGKEIHSMTMSATITNTPPNKPHVVCAQIHDANDDLMMIRLEGSKLFIERNEFDVVMLDRKYELGQPIDLVIQAGKGKVKVWHNGEPKMDWSVTRQGCYFKAGCYTQSNPDKGDSADSYGEVMIHKLKVETRTLP